MKKLLFAATLVALLPLLFSCGKENNGGENKFEEPRFVQYAGKLVPRGGDPAPTSLISQRAETSPIKYLEFTESGLFVLGRQLLGGLSFSTGTYTTTDGLTFTLSNGSTVTVSGSSGAVDVTISPSGESFKATLTKASGTNVAYRSWTIDKVRATIKGHGDPVTAEFNGCNFVEIKKFLNDNGHKGDYLPDCSLTSVSFTGANSVLFAFSDNMADVGDCTISLQRGRLFHRPRHRHRLLYAHRARDRRRLHEGLHRAGHDAFPLRPESRGAARHRVRRAPFRPRAGAAAHSGQDREDPGA